jgi:hypothetical protein
MGLLIVLGFVLLVFGSAEVATRARRAANRRFAAAQPSSTWTVIGVRDKDIVSTLAQAQHGGRSAVRAPYVFLVTFSAEGVRFWTAGNTPRAVETIAADRVLGIDIGSYTERPEYNQPSLPRLKVTVSQLQEPAAPPVDLEFGLLKEASGAYLSRYLDEAGVQDAVVRARTALTGGDHAAATVTTTTSFTPRPGTLEPGTTAFRAAHIGKLPLTHFTTVVSVATAPILLIAVLQRMFALAIGLIVLEIAVMLALMWRETRAVTREEAAGYTTLNGKHLNLEQRHPVSGMVIREAGGTAISKERFRELLGR